MTKETHRQQTLQLVALGDLDVKRTETQQLIEAVPRILKGRERESKNASEQVEAAKTKLQGFKAHLKSLELELDAREQAHQKASANMMTAKSNSEYTLLMEEVERKKEDKGQIETQILEQYEVIKQGERLVAEAEVALAASKKEFDEFHQRAQREMDTHREELDRFNERREQLRRGIDADVLKLYDRAFGAHGTALSAVESEICQGCFSKITPNDKSRLVSAREVILCRSCNRILYLPETLHATPS